MLATTADDIRNQPAWLQESHVAHLTKGHEDIVEACQAEGAISIPAAPLQPPPVVSHVDVGEVIDELDQAGDDSVEAVRTHLLANKDDEGPGRSHDPVVQHVGRL